MISKWEDWISKEYIYYVFVFFFISSSVNNEEIARFVRSLKVLEHCIQPFLDHCDTDNDNKISSDEWGTCLGLDKSMIFLCFFTIKINFFLGIIF
jgi:hypothetical protein